MDNGINQLIGSNISRKTSLKVLFQTHYTVKLTHLLIIIIRLLESVCLYSKVIQLSSYHFRLYVRIIDYWFNLISLIRLALAQSEITLSGFLCTYVTISSHGMKIFWWPYNTNKTLNNAFYHVLHYSTSNSSLTGTRSWKKKVCFLTWLIYLASSFSSLECSTLPKSTLP